MLHAYLKDYLLDQSHKLRLRTSHFPRRLSIVQRVDSRVVLTTAMEGLTDQALCGLDLESILPVFVGMQTHRLLRRIQHQETIDIRSDLEGMTHGRVQGIIQVHQLCILDHMQILVTGPMLP